MSCTDQSTGAVPVQYCQSCGEPEHGSLACNNNWQYRAPDWLSTPTVLRKGTYRIMDDRLFRVDPGSPPSAIRRAGGVPWAT